MSLVFWVALALIAGKGAVEIGLARLNRKHVLANRARVPEAFAGVMEPEAYAKSVEYTLAKNRLGQFETVYDTFVLLLAPSEVMSSISSGRPSPELSPMSSRLTASANRR